MSKYHKKSHCKYLIKIHLVFVTKYRKNIINGIFRDDLLQILYDISLEKGFYASIYKVCIFAQRFFRIEATSLIKFLLL